MLNGIVHIEVIRAEDLVSNLTMGVCDVSIWGEYSGINSDMVCCSAIQDPRLNENIINNIRERKQTCNICLCIVITRGMIH